MISLNDQYEKINQHPGKRAHDNWSNLKITYSGIFVVNRNELLALLSRPIEDELLRIELIQNVRPQDTKEAYQSEMLRMLHNYITSASSLIDHSRRLIKQYSGSTFNKEYDERREVLAETAEHCLLKDLRNYLVHFDILPSGWSIGVGMTGEETFTPMLTTSRLLEWDKWSVASRKFIESSGEFIELVLLINGHAKMIDDFYEWIFLQFTKLHGKQIDEVNEMILLTLPDDVKRSRGYIK